MEKQMTMREIIIGLALTPAEIEKYRDVLTGDYKSHDLAYYKRLMEIYPENKQLVATIMWNDCIGYAIRKAGVYRKMVSQSEFEGLVSAAKLGVLEGLTKYNATRMPTTYFDGYIMDHIHKTLNGDITKATSRIHRKAEKAKQELANEGIFDPSVDLLSRKTGLSPEVIRQNEALYHASKTKTSLYSEDCPTEIIPAFDRFDESLNPEAQFLQSEKSETILNEIKELLSDVEAGVLWAMEVDKMSIKATGETFGIPQTRVYATYQSAITKLRNSERLKEYFQIFDAEDEDELKFLDDEDVFADIEDFM